MAFHITHITLHRSYRQLQYPIPCLFFKGGLPKTSSSPPPARHSYGFAAIQCHLSFPGPLK